MVPGAARGVVQVVVFIMGPGTQESDGHALVSALHSLSMAFRAVGWQKCEHPPSPAPALQRAPNVQALTPREAFFAQSVRLVFAPCSMLCCFMLCDVDLHLSELNSTPSVHVLDVANPRLTCRVAYRVYHAAIHGVLCHVHASLQAACG